MKKMDSKIAKEYLQGMIDSFNDESVPGFCINGAFVKPLYVDSEDCETFRFAIDALEKLERVEQMIDKANRVYDDVNWWIAVSDIEKTVKGEIVPFKGGQSE